MGKEEGKSERLRGERDKIKFIDLRFEREQVVGFINQIDNHNHQLNCFCVGFGNASNLYCMSAQPLLLYHNNDIL